MASPTGTCNGQPCWTPSDLSTLDAEIAVKQAEIAVQQAIIDQATTERNTLMNQLNVLQSQKINALMNKCP